MFYILTGIFVGAFENFIIMRSAYLHAKNEGFPLIEPSTNLPMLYSFLKRTYTPGLDFTQRPFVRLPFFKYTSCFKCIALLKPIFYKNNAKPPIVTQNLPDPNPIFQANTHQNTG